MSSMTGSSVGVERRCTVITTRTPLTDQQLRITVAKETAGITRLRSYTLPDERDIPATLCEAGGR
jgi:hypothetical protein